MSMRNMRGRALYSFTPHAMNWGGMWNGYCDVRADEWLEVARPQSEAGAFALGEAEFEAHDIDRGYR